MKTLIKVQFFLLLIFVLNNNAFAQADMAAPVTGHTGGGNTGYYLGWDNSTTFPLNLRHDNYYPIYWWTNNISRMQIYEDQAGGTATNSGFVGIGEFATSGFIPYSLLHLNNNGTDAMPNTFLQVTNANTGFGSSQTGLQVGVLYDATPNFYTGGPQGTGADYSIAALRQWMDAPMVFYTNDGSNNMSERVRIAYGNGGPNANANTTKVNISYASVGAGFPVIGANQPPVAMLNLGEDASNGSGPIGQRPWMDVGTFGSFNTDDFYVGLKNEGVDRNDATIVWGDNFSNAGYKDYLRFIFASSTNKTGATLGLANDADGVEVGRFSPQGHFGVGNFSFGIAAGGTQVDPARTLEVYDDALNNPTANPVPSHNPQLRLTFMPTSYQGASNAGIYTDFQSTSLGDLYIHPSTQGGTNNATATERFVGINMNTPQSELHQHLANISSAAQEVWHQFTNGNTNATSTDGFRVGITGSTTSSAELRQQENAPMNFYTDYANNAAVEMTILGNGNVGINTATPNATSPLASRALEINSGTANTSGLRFTNMNNTVTPQTNPDPQKGVLSVDNNGDVIFVVDEDNGGSGTGDVTACTATGGTTANYVTKWTSTAKEICVSEIYDNGTGVGINSLPYNTSTKFTLKGIQASSAGTPATSINSIFMDANNNDLLQIRDNGTVLIGNGIGNTGSFVDGQLGIGGGFGSPISSRLEIHGSSGGLGRCIEVDNSSNPLFYVYDNGRVGISTNAPSYPLDVQAGTGTVARFTGSILCNTTTYPSDAMFKTNISNITGANSILNQLIPHQYEYDSAAYPQMHFSSVNQFGFLAQELEQVVPELVGNATSPEIKDMQGNIIDSSFEFKTVNYVGLIPLLVSALKEQNQTIDSMRTGMMAMQA